MIHQWVMNLDSFKPLLMLQIFRKVKKYYDLNWKLHFLLWISPVVLDFNDATRGMFLLIFQDTIIQ